MAVLLRRGHLDKQRDIRMHVHRGEAMWGNSRWPPAGPQKNQACWHLYVIVTSRKYTFAFLKLNKKVLEDIKQRVAWSDVHFEAIEKGQGEGLLTWSREAGSERVPKTRTASVHTSAGGGKRNIKDPRGSHDSIWIVECESGTVAWLRLSDWTVGPC
jgi:hypothetical protein